jgi:pimeloyl-ACP methyl ester carboxylesterase
VINGGPGGSSTELERAVDVFTKVGQGLEIYFLDHRGTGKSQKLSCPAEEAASSDGGADILGAEWSQCAQSVTKAWGDDLAGFNVTEAATDLGELIERTRHDGDSVNLYSVSYGTYLAQRYLQLYPNQASSVVLDSICSPGACHLLLDYDRSFDATVREVLSSCAKDSTCSEQFGSDPDNRLKSVSNSLSDGHCSSLGWSKTTLRHVLGFMVMYVGIRDYIPAVIRRVERCSKNDVDALKVLESVLSQFNTTDTTFSTPLFANIALSELSEDPLPNAEDVSANVESLYASVDAGANLAPAIATWPLYHRDEYYGKFAKTSVPLLMLNGTLDPQTPLKVATPTGEYFKGENQHFIVIPYAAHTTLTQSPMDAEYHSCGAELILQFFQAPTKPIDPSCVDLVLPLDFRGTADVTKLLFGTDAPFSDDPVKTTSRLTPQTVRRFNALLRPLSAGFALTNPLPTAL